jgi:N-acetylglucosamine malate deacetylase 1
VSERTPIDVREPCIEPVVLDELARGPVLLFAPHPDDEVIGAGGTCLRHVAAGDEVHVVVVYDGALGRRGFEHMDEAAFVALRQDECRAACRALGFASVMFLGHPEGRELSDDDRTKGAEQMAALIRRFAPRTVYAPWPGESHPDHHTLARAVAVAIDELHASDGPVPELWTFEVWSTFHPSHVVDVSEQWPAKASALALHHSQASVRDLSHYVEGLNHYRALYIDRPGATHAEGLIHVDGGRR